MKKNFIITMLALACITHVSAQDPRDIAQIKAMCGCYEVRFSSAETFQHSDDPHYQPSKTKHSGALEWITPISETNNKISLQHFLIVNNKMVVKHWRQDWTYQNPTIWEYKGFHGITFTPKTPEEVKGQWAQEVFEVDDTPRYMGSGTWVYVDGKRYWESTTNSPLPRREYTNRSDYNILKRTNKHIITDFGWIHEQDNIKIKRDPETRTDQILAYEKGYNTYTKVHDERCLAAKQYWDQYQNLWEKVRIKWDSALNQNKDLSFRQHAEVDQILDKFIIQ